MEQGRLLLALALSALLMFAYQELVLKRAPVPMPPADVETPAGPSPTAAPTIPPGAAPALPSAPVAPSAASTLAAPAGERTVTVETDAFRALFTPTGARLADLELRDFRRDVKPDSPPLDLVHAGPVLPLTLVVAGTSDAGVAYAPNRETLNVTGTGDDEVVFTGTVAGWTVEKHYRFSARSHAFDLSVRVSGKAAPPSVSVLLTPLEGNGFASRVNTVNAIVLANNKLVEKPVPASADQEVHEQWDGSAWVGFANQYFLMATVPLPQSSRSEFVVPAGGVGHVVATTEQSPDGAYRFLIYAGPKQREVLASAGHDLERAVDFGWFWFVALPLLSALRVLHRVVGNWGVAIIVLTALVKAATVPLTQATFRNMREMQKLQPQIARLRERFKDDQMAMQKELMELYKRHRVNPFSGCLPMVLQLPVFVGLYNALSHAIELRHAPFMLWIDDLSAPDRLMVLGVGVPVLTLFMGASMLVQQWVSPQQADPQQQKVMMIMPLVFTFMFINFPSGLVLYWLVNNVLTIAQQYFVMRDSREPRAVKEKA